MEKNKTWSTLFIEPFMNWLDFRLLTQPGVFHGQDDNSRGVWEDLALGQVTHSGSWNLAILVAEEEEDGELADRKQEMAGRQSSKGGETFRPGQSWPSRTNMRECATSNKYGDEDKDGWHVVHAHSYFPQSVRISPL